MLSHPIGINMIRQHIDAITSQFGLKQLIQEPTHILNDSSSCIDPFH